MKSCIRSMKSYGEIWRHNYTFILLLISLTLSAHSSTPCHGLFSRRLSAIYCKQQREKAFSKSDSHDLSKSGLSLLVTERGWGLGKAMACYDVFNVTRTYTMISLSWKAIERREWFLVQRQDLSDSLQLSNKQ